jgi:hypothetical protein
MVFSIGTATAIDLGSTQRCWQPFQTNNSGNSPLSRKHVADPQDFILAFIRAMGVATAWTECEDVTGHTPRCLRRPITKGTCALARQPRGGLELRKQFGQAIPIPEFGLLSQTRTSTSSANSNPNSRNTPRGQSPSVSDYNPGVCPTACSSSAQASRYPRLAWR